MSRNSRDREAEASSLRIPGGKPFSSPVMGTGIHTDRIYVDFHIYKTEDGSHYSIIHS